MARRSPAKNEVRSPAGRGTVCLSNGRRGLRPALIRADTGPGFFVLFYVYFAWGIDVRLVYHCGGLIDNFPCFYLGPGLPRRFSRRSRGGHRVRLGASAQSLPSFLAWCGCADRAGRVLYACADCVVQVSHVPHLRGCGFSVRSCCSPVYSQYGFPFLTTMGSLAALLGPGIYLVKPARPAPFVPSVSTCPSACFCTSSQGVAHWYSSSWVDCTNCWCGAGRGSVWLS